MGVKIILFKCVCVCVGLCVFFSCSPYIYPSTVSFPQKVGLYCYNQKKTSRRQPKRSTLGGSGRNHVVPKGLCPLKNRGTTTTTLPQPTLVKATGGYLVEWKLDSRILRAKNEVDFDQKKGVANFCFNRKSRWNPRGNIDEMSNGWMCFSLWFYPASSVIDSPKRSGRL